MSDRLQALSRLETLMLGYFPLTTCCPANGAAGGLSPDVWQRYWSWIVYLQWCGSAGKPPITGSAAYLNYGPEAFTGPAPDAELLPAWPLSRESQQVSSLWALQVFNHIEAPKYFLRDAAKLLPPGGLLVGTVLLWDSEGEDIASGHDGRRRIYNIKTWKELVQQTLPRCGFVPFGLIDWRWRGAAYGEYTLATFAATRKVG